MLKGEGLRCIIRMED
ncbi:unnamed protein product [Linum tenue]|nr:unnamed protein product [Linum tenue]